MKSDVKWKLILEKVSPKQQSNNEHGGAKRVGAVHDSGVEVFELIMFPAPCRMGHAAIEPL